MDRMLSGVAYVLYNEPTSAKSYISLQYYECEIISNIRILLYLICTNIPVNRFSR